MNKYGLSGNMKAKEGKGSELAAILLEAAAGVANAKGCHIYIVAQDAHDADLVWITEVWDTKEDHHASLKLPGTPEMIARAMPLLDGMPKMGTVTNVLGGHGLQQ